MKHRNPVAVFLFSLITFGIYGLVWEVKTKGEMNQQGADIPTAWLLIIPIVSLYWLWKYSEGVEHVTGGKVSAVLSFILLFLLSIIGLAIIQGEFNKVAGQPAPMAGNPVATPSNPVSTPTIAPSQPAAVAPPAAVFQPPTSPIASTGPGAPAPIPPSPPAPPSSIPPSQTPPVV